VLFRGKHLAAGLFIFFVLNSHAFGREIKTKNAFWRASGTAFCYNYENISIWVGMSYIHQDEALTELWSRAVTACQSKGGLYMMFPGQHTLIKELPGKTRNLILRSLLELLCFSCYAGAKAA